jgi:hypothetical protein
VKLITLTELGTGYKMAFNPAYLHMVWPHVPAPGEEPDGSNVFILRPGQDMLADGFNNNGDRIVVTVEEDVRTIVRKVNKGE